MYNWQSRTPPRYTFARTEHHKITYIHIGRVQRHKNTGRAQRRQITSVHTYLQSSTPPNYIHAAELNATKLHTYIRQTSTPPNNIHSAELKATKLHTFGRAQRHQITYLWQISTPTNYIQSAELNTTKVHMYWQS